MIRKLLLVRKKDASSTVLSGTDFAKYVVGEPLEICPLCKIAWNPEAGLSHYAWVIELPKLKDVLAFRAWNEDHKTVRALILDCNDDPETSLASVGLRINPLS